MLERLATDLLVTQGCTIQPEGVTCSRSTVQTHILRIVNQVFDLVQKSYWDACLLYSQLPLSETAKEECDKALRSCLSLRELLAETWMATKYFNYMLNDLD